jgi:hypothetical protein
MVPETLRLAMRHVFLPTLNTRCLPQASKPALYKFRAPIPMEELFGMAKPMGYIATKQIVNYQGKVVYLVLKRDNQELPVPCAPSAIFSDPSPLQLQFMEDESFFRKYHETVEFLTTLYENSDRKIPCLPVMKVVEDEMVVGILTQSNQFVMTLPPIPLIETNDRLFALKGNNYIKADNETIHKNGIDQERVDVIHKIKDESRYYQMFRNAVRILINKYENLKLREEIDRKIKSFDSYHRKLDGVLVLLKTLVKETILFGDSEKEGERDKKEERDKKDQEGHQHISCLLCNKEECAKRGPLCMFTKKDGCILKLPAKNTLTGTDNETNYYKKMADELIRYHLIYQYIFEPQKMLTMGEVNYNVRDNEIVVPQSFITQEYFEQLVSTNTNPYVKYNTVDTVNPLQTDF